MKVMKFGGTSVGSGSRILHVAKIIKNHTKRDRVVVVISAMSGVTDKLISVFQKYKLQNLNGAREELSGLYLLHIEAVKDLKLKNGTKEIAEKLISELFGQLITHLTFQKQYSLSDYDFVISFGERLSVVLLNTALQKIGVYSKVVDSREIIVTNEEFGNSSVYFDKTKERVEKFLFPLIMDGVTPVVTGFYGASKGGRITTLGRGGSDYTATIIAHALEAQEVILWKEVDGVYSHDPKKNGNGAKFFSQLTYKEAIKLSQNGAKIIHPHALDCLASKEIVVWVKNTFKPDFAGTKIWRGII